jgi:hypothetical protein
MRALLDRHALLVAPTVWQARSRWVVPQDAGETLGLFDLADRIETDSFSSRV